MGAVGTARDVEARYRAHAVFDRLWRKHGWSRPSAYRWLALRLRIQEDACHFSMFDAARCNQVIEIVLQEMPHLRVTRAALRSGNDPRGRGKNRRGKRPPSGGPEMRSPMPRSLADAVDDPFQQSNEPPTPGGTT